MRQDLHITSAELDYEVIISAEENFLESEDDNVDVSVRFHNGKFYTATFFTLKNIQSLFNKNKDTGECNFGKYFYCTDMILVEKLTSDIVFETIKNLIKTGEFKSAFRLQSN